MKLKDDEVVVFSWIVHRSRTQRDRISAREIADPRLKFMVDPKAMSFDSRRRFRGGFKSFVDLAA